LARNFNSWKCVLKNGPKQGNNSLYKNAYNIVARDSEKRLDQPSLQKQKGGTVKKTKKYIYTYVREYYSAVI